MNDSAESFFGTVPQVEELLLVPAGLFAGVVNAVAGGGSLLSFPLLLALGYSPLVANVTNSVGIFPSNIGAIHGYRNTLMTHRRPAMLLGSAVGVGTICGITLLLTTGEAVFESVVPVMMAAAALMMLLQPKLVKQLGKLHPTTHMRMACCCTFVVGAYGGYFGPGLGVMLLATFGTLVSSSMQVTNALKNFSAIINNTLCVLLFAVFADIAWSAALCMGVGTLAGGFVGTRIATRLPDKAFRIAVVVFGLAAALWVALS